MHVSYFRNKFSTYPHPPGADKSPIMLDELKSENDLPPTTIIKHEKSEITIEENNVISHEELKPTNVTIYILLLHIFYYIMHIVSMVRSHNYTRLEILRIY